jgi:glycosyltransferase involved in cell wall biosynthesis
LEGVFSGIAMKVYPGRLALQQRVFPVYRVPFFDMLATTCKGGLSILAGQPLPVEGIKRADNLNVARFVETQNIHFGKPSSSVYLCWQRGLIPWLENWNPNALIVEANPRYLSTRLAVRWMHQHDRLVLGWGLGVPRNGTQIERLFRNAFLRRLDGVIAYSQRGFNEYHALGLESVFVAFNAATPKPDAELVPPPLVHEGIPTVLFVGRLQARKQVDILIHACRELPHHLQPRLVIVGDGPARRGLENLANEEYPQTVFVGAQYDQALESFFENADLFALPGTGGLAIQQAMAHGLPIIVAQGDGTQDDLVRSQNGWQIPPGDQFALTNTLREALSDLPRLRRMGAESYRIVAEEINLETMVEVFIQALNSVQASRSV